MLVGYLQKLEITNARGNVLTLLTEEDDGPYQIAEIEGLDPGKAVLTASRNAGVDGEIFQSATRPARNIKIKLDLDPDFDANTYEDARNELYRWFMPKAKVSQRYHLSTGLYLDIDGVVESNDSPMFEDDPDVTISLMCYDPDFIDSRIVTVPGFTVANTTNIVIEYPGTVEAGTVITINPNRTVDDFTIYNQDEAGILSRLDFTGPLLAGDHLVISSLRGNKGITLTRGTTTSSFLYGRSAQSNWIKFVEGLNQFRIYAEGAPVPYVLEYVPRYGGL